MSRVVSRQLGGLHWRGRLTYFVCINHKRWRRRRSSHRHRCHVARSFTLLGLWGVLVVVVGAFRRRWLSFWGGCVWCVVLLSLLGGRGRLLGGCRPSWADGVVSVIGFVWIGMELTWWEGGYECVVVVASVVGLVRGGCWLKKRRYNVWHEHCWCSNVHVRSHEDDLTWIGMLKLVSSCLAMFWIHAIANSSSKLICSHPSNPLHLFDAEIDGICA